MFKPNCGLLPCQELSTKLSQVFFIKVWGTGFVKTCQYLRLKISLREGEGGSEIFLEIWLTTITTVKN